MDLDRRTLLGLPGAGLVGGAAWTTTRDAVSGATTGPDTRPATSEEHLEAFVRGNTDFGLDVLRSLTDTSPEGNLLFSPFSIATALAMTWAGASGETESQMASTLAYPLDQDALHPAIGALQYDLNERAEDVPAREIPHVWRTNRFDLTVANSLWGQMDYPFEESFLRQLDRNYGAGVRRVDFEANPDGVRDEVNDWVAAATNDRIYELFEGNTITHVTRLVLANAVYLLADWADPFDPDDTTDAEFENLDGSTSTVSMMDQTGDFPYHRTPAGHQLIELPYVGDAISMLVLLPPADEAIESVEAVLDHDQLAAYIESLGESEVAISLPRFEFDFDVGLASLLADLGMPDPFDPGRADFRGMVQGDDDPGLFVQDVRHEAYVAVDEAGTEAAAATGVSMGESGPMAMVVDRPFLFVIRDRPTDAVLFVGRAVDGREFE